MRELTGFAEACYNDCTIAQLEECLRGEVDKTDCETWGITEDQWRAAIAEALAAKKAGDDYPSKD